MLAADIFRRSGRNLRRAKMRTILTSLAIGVGAFTITLALAAGSGGRAFTNELIATSGDEQSLVIYPKVEQADNSHEEELPEYGAPVEITNSNYTDFSKVDLKKIRQIDGVESAEPVINAEIAYVTRGDGAKKLIAPVQAKVDRAKANLLAGELDNNMLDLGQAMLSEDFLEDFGFDNPSSALGQELDIAVTKIGSDDEIKLFPVKIVAVDHDADTNVYYSPVISISQEDIQSMYEYQHGTVEIDDFFSITALLKPDVNVESVQTAIRDAGYETYSLADARESLLQMVSVAQWGLTGFGALAILASIFGIINTMYISVLERTQQIGLMKALGASRKDIARLFRYEAAWIGLLGGVIGAGLALAMTLLNPVIATALNLEEGIELLRFNWIGTLILIVILILVAVVSSHFPSRKAARLDPIEALRTE